MSSLLTRLLIGLNLTAGLGIVAGITFAWHTAGASDRSSTTASSTAPVPAERPAVTLAAAREKPIFTPTRLLPAVSSVGNQQGDNASGPAPRLMGVLRLGPGRQRALFQDVSNGEQQWRTEGQGVNGWTVLQIRSQEVRLERAGETLTVRLLPAGFGSSASGSLPFPPTSSSAMPIEGPVAMPPGSTAQQADPTPTMTE